MTTIALCTYTLEILPDADPADPCWWDNLGTMACWHRRYALGDRHDDYPDPPAFAAEVNGGNAVILPLYLFDHSGLTISTDSATFRAFDQAGWDWGQLGFIYVTLADVRREFGAKRVTRQLRARVEAYLIADVATYNSYLQGEVYGYLLKDLATGEITDSCWGFYGDDPLENGMADHLPPEVRDKLLSHLRVDAGEPLGGATKGVAP